MQQQQQRQPEGGLLRSQQWASVLRAEGKDVLEVFCRGVQIFALVQHVPHIGRYLYVPRLCDDAVACFDALIAIAQEHQCAWIRTDVATKHQLQQLKKQTIVRAPHDMQPAEHFIIDISADKESLLSGMKAKTRYNIRLAKKRGVVVHYVTRRDDDFDKMFDIFYQMVQATGRRKGVRFHDRAHYRAMFDHLGEKTIALYLAEIDGDFIAANIVTFYNDTATYLHGATADHRRNLMAPFLLQWEAMKGAKIRGCRYYDFGGVYSSTKDAGKKGITRFKRGFAPQETITMHQGSYDIVLSAPQYFLYRFFQKIKSLRDMLYDHTT